MKYKIGDKVRIKSREWFDAYDKNEHGDIFSLDRKFIREMFECCNMEATIVDILGCYYILDIDDNEWFWQDWMLEDVAE